jgi:hypothetical protein
VAARRVKGIQHLAVDVELILLERRVADANGLRALVAREPGKLAFGQPALT